MTSLVASAAVLLCLLVCSYADPQCNSVDSSQTIIVVVSSTPVETILIQGDKVLSRSTSSVSVPVLKPDNKTNATQTEKGATSTQPDKITVPTNPNDRQTTEEQENLQPDDFKCDTEGSFIIPGNCTYHYQCVENRDGGHTKHLFKCGEGFVWDSGIGGCNYVESADPPCGTGQD